MLTHSVISLLQVLLLFLVVTRELRLETICYYQPVLCPSLLNSVLPCRMISHCDADSLFTRVRNGGKCDTKRVSLFRVAEFHPVRILDSRMLSVHSFVETQVFFSQIFFWQQGPFQSTNNVT